MPGLSQTMLLHRKLQRLVGEAISEFSLIGQGDRILIALSGGKDSLALLDLLGERMRRSNGYFSLEAAHVRMRHIRYETDAGYLRGRAAAWDIPFHLIETDFDTDRNPKRTPCFLCSWYRRKALFELAKQRGIRKIALGHHLDDIVRTALMNLTFNGSFSSMEVSLTMRKFDMTLIRPLAKIREDDLLRWAEEQGYRPVHKVCPYDTATNRTRIQEVAACMERLNPDYRQSLWRALHRPNP